MADMELPELPEPFPLMIGFQGGSGPGCEIGRYHSADQMTAYGKACYMLALEKATEICDNMGPCGFTGESCAEAIRDLKEPS